MVTITMRISEDLNNKLETLSHQEERSKSYFMRKALISFLEEVEDYEEALSILAQNNKRYTLEEIEKKLGLEN